MSVPAYVPPEAPCVPTIPDAVAGHLIGQDGHGLRLTAYGSNAQITVGKAATGSTASRMVPIHGTSQEIEPRSSDWVHKELTVGAAKSSSGEIPSDNEHLVKRVKKSTDHLEEIIAMPPSTSATIAETRTYCEELEAQTRTVEAETRLLDLVHTSTARQVAPRSKGLADHTQTIAMCDHLCDQVFGPKRLVSPSLIATPMLCKTPALPPPTPAGIPGTLNGEAIFRARATTVSRTPDQSDTKESAATTIPPPSAIQCDGLLRSEEVRATQPVPPPSPSSGAQAAANPTLTLVPTHKVPGPTEPTKSTTNCRAAAPTSSKTTPGNAAGVAEVPHGENTSKAARKVASKIRKAAAALEDAQNCPKYLTVRDSRGKGIIFHLGSHHDIDCLLADRQGSPKDPTARRSLAWNILKSSDPESRKLVEYWTWAKG